jgi:hypothetical protein
MHPNHCTIPSFRLAADYTELAFNNHFAFRHYYLMLPSAPEVLEPVYAIGV